MASQNWKLAIIGDPNRKSKDQRLINEAEKEFKAEYIPITQLRLDLTKRQDVRYDGKSLTSFDYILLIPTITHHEMFYTVARMLKGKVKPFNDEQYLLVINEDILFKYLNRYGIATRNSIFICACKSLPAELKNLEFPVFVYVGAKRIKVTDMQTLKDVVALGKRGTPLQIKLPISAKKVVWVFVVGNEVVAGYEKSGKSVKSIEVDDEIKQIATKIRFALKCDYCALKFIVDRNGKIILDKLTFCPNLIRFEKITSKNVASYVIGDLKRRMEQEAVEWWVPRGILDAVKRIPSPPVKLPDIFGKEEKKTKKREKRKTKRRRRRSKH